MLCLLLKTNLLKFQSTPSWRGRLVCVMLAYYAVTFQSTPSWRGRHGNKNDISNPKLYFNPRPREEGDPIMFNVSVGQCISIHALVKRATAVPVVFIDKFNDFNPRPREEGDLFCARFAKYCWKFQSTPSWRGRLFQNALVLGVVLFQSTPSWRGRPPPIIISAISVAISIHALVKRATGVRLIKRSTA